MINPVRLHGRPANIARYYALGDYYSKGPDEHSEWGGAIAHDLGLEGKVDPSLFQELLAGRVGDQQLGRRRIEGGVEHHPGWDFAVSAPKSVSIMALVAGDERIIAAHEKAVGTALAYLEEHASLRRREKGEIVHEATGRLLFARFTEHASRQLDPHLHTHVVVLNMTNKEEGAHMASLETRAMFTEQMTAGQAYRNELAFTLRELGYGVEHDPRSGLFEIKGVPQALIRDFSQRAEQIEAHAEQAGHSGQAQRQASFYATRGPKVKTNLEGLHERWDAMSKPHRRTLSDVRDDADKEAEKGVAILPTEAGRAALFGLRQAETREAVNNKGRIVRLGLAAHVGETRLSDILPYIDEHEQRRKLLSTRHQTGDAVLVRGRTSRRTARMEQALGRHLALGIDDARPVASADRILAVLEGAGLKPGQEQALVQAATSRDRVAGIHGVAGAGKSTLVAIMQAAASPGTELIALAPTSSAASELGARAGIPSRTVASLLASGGHGLTPDHVLVLDEAGQLGNRQALRMLEVSHITGARLILLGDNSQTGAIEQGKAFWLLQKLGLPTAELTESVRQETRSMRKAVSEARDGNYGVSLAHLDKIISGDTANELAKALVAEWTRAKPETRASTNILVLDNATRLVVNTAVRETLKREGAIAAEDRRFEVFTPAGLSAEEKRFARFYSKGQVVRFGRDIPASDIAHGADYVVLGIGRETGGRQIVRIADENGRIHRWDPRTSKAARVNIFEREERDLATGDRIQWRLVTHELGLKNAERGTVEKLDGTQATIRWDRGDRLQKIDLSVHKSWDHGYAETVYSAQSKTYARVYMLAPIGSSLVTGQNYYTAITRARLGVKLWTEDPKRLAQKLERNSGEKTSALEGLGRLDADAATLWAKRHQHGVGRDRLALKELGNARHSSRQAREPAGFAERLAERVAALSTYMDRILMSARLRSEQRSQGSPVRENAVEHSQPRREAARPSGPER